MTEIHALTRLTAKSVFPASSSPAKRCANGTVSRNAASTWTPRQHHPQLLQQPVVTVAQLVAVGIVVERPRPARSASSVGASAPVGHLESPTRCWTRANPAGRSARLSEVAASRPWTGASSGHDAP